ncbi:MAG TPA: efflux RND transporter periplasmic adaptor subunit [Caulobacteraceae bacterium]|nr:efflux RND transporter periplasmic adaptor subunit [Caulobacteraceae bacterium]
MSQLETSNPSQALAQPTPSAEALHHAPVRWLKPAGFVGLGLAAAIVAVGLVSRGVASHNLKVWTDAQAIPTVSVVRPDSNLGPQTLVLPGQVQAFYNATIRAQVDGYLKRWYTDIGAQVKAGQVLADIDTPALDQQLAQAKADLVTAQANQRLAQTTAARWNGLLAQDAVSRQEAEEKNGDLAAKTALVDAARANVQRLQAQEGFKRIVAPFAGVVTARNTDVGALINTGNPNDPGLFTVADVHRLRIYVSVPQDETAQIHPGEAVTLQVPEYPGRVFKATLVSTSGAIGDRSGALTAEAQIDNADGALKPGDYAQVSFDLPAQPGAMQLPASALMFLHSGMAVGVVGPGDKVVMKPVTIAKDLGATVQIATGLSPGDAVIVNPPDSLVTGEKVRVAQGPA